MNTRQKGASGLATIFIALIVIAVVAIGFWWHHSATTVASDTTASDTTLATTASSPGYSYIISTSTPSAPNTGTAYTGAASIQTNTNTQTAYTAPKTKTTTYTTYERRPVAAASGYAGITGISGSVYHNSTYGLSLRLPSSGWRAYMTSGGPAGLPGTAQIHFVAPGESADAFVVNVWGKAGWNYVRTQENFVHLNTTNIGEGTYLGENFTWIYSYTVYTHPAEAQTALSGAVFY